MKRFSTILGIVALCCTLCPAARAQSSDVQEDKYPYAFIAAKGGAFWQFQPQEYNIKTQATPIVGIDFGGMFTPVVGARLAMEGWHEKGRMPYSDNNKYEFNALSPNLDLMLDVTNLFYGKKPHVLHAYAIGGVGFSVERGHMTYYDTELATSASRFAVNYRAGAQIEARAGRRVGIFAEVLGTNLHSPHRPHLTKQGEWHLQAMLGLNIKIGAVRKNKKTVTSVTAPTTPEPAPQPAVTETPTKQPLVEEKKPVAEQPKAVEMKSEVFYKIGSATPNAKEQQKVESLAQWLKDNPNTKVTIVGYADAGTGTAQINERLSKKRAENIAKQLTQKYGIDASRISTSYKGDTFQPFAENDANRVVLISGK